MALNSVTEEEVVAMFIIGNKVNSINNFLDFVMQNISGFRVFVVVLWWRLKV